MANINGLELNIDDSFLNKLGIMDSLLEQVADSAEGTGESLKKMVEKISTGGIEKYVKGLEQTHAALLAISQVKTNDEGIQELAEDASAAAISVLSLVNALKKTEEYSKATWNKALHDERSTTAGALQYAEMAKSINEMKAAQKYLLIARGNADVNDATSINQLNEAYTRLRATIEKLTTAEKNEQTLQPTLRNEYARLLVELDKINAAHERLTKTRKYKEDKEWGFTSVAEVALMNRLADVQEKMQSIEKAAQPELKKRIELEREITEWIAERQRIGKLAGPKAISEARKGGGTQEAEDYLFAEKNVEELKAQLRAVESQESAIDEVKRKHEANRAMETIASIEKTEQEAANRTKRIWERQLAESSKYGSISSYSADRLIDVTDDVQNIASEIEVVKKLEHARETLNKDDERYEETLDRLNQKIAEHTHNVKMATDAQYRENQAKQEAERQNTTYQGALDSSENATSINARIKAIENLKKARASLDRSSMPKEEYAAKVRTLTNEINRQEKEVKRLTGAYDNMGKKQRNLMNIGDQLQRKVALWFSVSQVMGYAKHLADVRGEFEIQNKSLEVLLQNKGEADKLWQQTLALAVKSPFRIKELISYTKQLAAYRIETGKLHDTTKMLADVSAGLGVDMQRLILAYGQVRTAEFLRGTELRQFTEAGIPLLEELKKHLQEVEGVSLTVGDVFERISKRQIAFSDVDAVFKNITEKGGAFYRMQEQQSETLRGMMSNLKDSVDIMLNDIGLENEEQLKGAISLVKDLTENWRQLIGIGAGAGVLLGGTAVTSAISQFKDLGKDWGEVVENGEGLIATVGKVRAAFVALRNTLVAHPVLAVVAAIAGAGLALYGYSEKIDAVNRQYEKQIQLEGERLLNFRKMAEEAKANNTVIAQSNKDDAESQEKLNAARGRNINIVDKLKSEYPSVIKYIKQEENGVIELSEALKVYNEEAARRVALQEAAKKSFFSDDAKTNLAEAAEASAKMDATWGTVLGKLSTAVGKLELMKNHLSPDVYENAKNAMQSVFGAKDAEEALMKLQELYAQMDFARNVQVKQILYDSFGIEEWGDLIDDELGHFKTRMKDFASSQEKLLEIVVGTMRKHLYLNGEEGAKHAKEYFEGVLKEFGVQDERVRQALIAMLPADIRTRIVWADEQGKALDESALKEDWQRRLWRLVKDINTNAPDVKIPITIEAIVSGEETKDQLFDLLRQTGDDWVKDWEERSGIASKGEQQIYTPQEAANILKNEKKQANYVKKLLGLGDKGGGKGGDKTRDILGERISLIKDMAKAYEDLIKDFTALESKQKVVDSYTKTFNSLFKGIGITISDIDFTKPQQVVEALQKMLPYVKANTKEYDKLQKAITEAQLSIDVKKQEVNRERLMGEIEKMFDGYDLTIELEELDIPKSWAQQFFNTKAIDLSDLRGKIQGELDRVIAGGGEEALAEDLKEKLEKVDDMERERQEKRLKEYLAYARDAVSERAKIKLEEANKLLEIERTFTREEDSEIKKRVQDKLRAESEQKMKKYEWDEFQKTDTFVNLFADLDNASSALINHALIKLREFKNEWKDMPHEEMKSIVGKINDLELALVNIDPFSSYKAIKAEIKKAEAEASVNVQSAAAKSAVGVGDYENAFALESAYQEERAMQLDEEIAKLGTALRLKEEQKTQALLQTNVDTKHLANLSLEETAIKQQLKTAKQAKTEAEGKLEANQNNLQLYRKEDKANKQRIESLKAAVESASKLHNAFKALNSALGGNDSAGAALAEMGMSIVTATMDTILLQIQLNAAAKSATGFGAAMNAAMGVIGWIALAVQSIATIISTIAGNKDKRLEKRIEEQRILVENLQRAFEKLEKAIDSAFRQEDLLTYTKQAEQNLKKQIAATEKMIAAEEDKKDTDHDRIRGWMEDIEDMKEALEELEESRIEALGGLGSTDNFKSQTESFVDAWLEAYKETGNGLKGLQEKFYEFFNNLAKKQLVMRAAGAMLSPLYSQIDAMFAEDSMEGANMTQQELDEVMAAANKLFPSLNEMLLNIMNELGMTDDILAGTGKLSGLQRGIQGITEEQAYDLASYLNSIRWFVSEQNAMFAEFFSNFTLTDVENPIVSQLKIVASQTTAINSLLQSLTAPHPSSGRGLKVVL